MSMTKPKPVTPQESVPERPAPREPRMSNDEALALSKKKYAALLARLSQG